MKIAPIALVSMLSLSPSVAATITALPPPVTGWSMALSNAATGENYTASGSGAGLNGGDIGVGRGQTNIGYGPVPFAAAAVGGAADGTVGDAPNSFGEADATLTYSYRVTAATAASFDAGRAYLLLHPGANGVGIGMVITGYMGVGVAGQGSAQASVDGGLGAASVYQTGCSTANLAACGQTAFTTDGGLVPDAPTLSFSGSITLHAHASQSDGGRAFAWVDPYINYHLEFSDATAADEFFKLAFSEPIVNATDPEPDFPIDLSYEVPEPATWAMMIAGFGLVGVASRRRRVTAAQLA